MKKAISIFAGLLFLASEMFGATYYVDLDGGNDSAAGTNQATAWLNLPGTATVASSSSASPTFLANTWASIVAGDVIKIKSGTTHSSADGGRVHISTGFYANTSLSNPITIQRDTTWGSGTVTFDGTGITTPGGGWGLIHIRRMGGIIIDGVAGVNNSYDGITVQDSDFCGISDHSGNTTSYPADAYQYIKFYNCGTSYSVSENASDAALRIRQQDAGTWVNYVEVDGNGLKLQGIGMADSAVRLVSAGVTNCLVYGLTGSNDGGIGFKAQNSDVTWKNCLSHSNYKGWDLGHDEAVATNHTDWGMTYKLINSEAFSNNFGINFSTIGFEGPFVGTNNFYVINCLVHDNTEIGSKVYAGPFSLHIIHSVYEGNDINVTVSRDGLSDTNSPLVARIYNSIFYKPTGTDGNVDHPYWSDTTDHLVVSSDYNAYIQNSTEYFSRFGSYGGGSDTHDFSYGANGPGHSSGTWYAFQSWNNDSHSVGTGADTTTAPPFTSVANNVYTIYTSYPGVNLSGQSWYLSEMGVDRNGVTRTTWDKGAYEFGGVTATANTGASVGIRNPSGGGRRR